MPKLGNRLPSLRRHKASNQAVVTLSGEDHYLGAFGSRSSRSTYDREIAEWIARGRLPRSASASHNPSTATVIAAYWAHAQTYYGAQNSGELRSVKLALGRLRRLYAESPARDFGPVKLNAVQRA